MVAKQIVNHVQRRPMPGRAAHRNGPPARARRRGKAGRRAPGGGDALGCSRARAVLVLVWLPARYPDGRPPDPAL